MNKLYKAIALAGVLGIVAVNFASAAEFMAPKDKNDSTLTVGVNDTHKNLYAAAGTVTINGSTSGDLFAAGATVTVNGPVEQDLFLAGGTIISNEKVGGDLRMAGGTLSVNSPVAGDVLIAGGSVSVTEKTSVGGDFIAGVGNLDLSAPVKGNVNIHGGSVTINSKIDGNVFVAANRSLTFGPKAEISGKIVFHGPSEAAITDGAKVSSVEFTKVTPKSFGNNFRGMITLGVLVKLLAMFIALLLLIKFMPGKTKAVLEIAHEKPWASLGIGFVSILVMPIAAIILFITFIGYYIGLIVLVFFFLFMLFSGLLASLFLGNLVIKWLTKKPSPILDWQSALIGVALLTAIGFIPVIGWVIDAILALIALGSIVQMARKEIN